MSAGFSVVFAADLSPGEGARPRCVTFDRDDLEERLATWAPRLELPEPYGAVTFTSLEDFEPDRLIAEVPRLRVWSRAAEEAGSISQVRELLGAAGESMPGGAGGEESSPKTPQAPRTVSESGLLDSILEDGPSDEEIRVRPESVTGDPSFDRAIETIVGATGEQPEPAEVQARRAAFEGVLASRLRSLLHRPELESLEASWRGLRDVARDVPTSAGVRLRALDIDWQALRDELANDAAESSLSRALKDLVALPGSEPVRMIFVDRLVEDTEEDEQLLRHLGQIGRDLKATVFIGAADSMLAACGQPDWSERRQAPELDHVALAWPRVLCRLPYGADTEPLDTLSFEETEEGTPYSWATPVYVIARILLRAHAQRIEDELARPEAVLTGLPIDVREDGVVGPLETLVTVDRLAELAEAGWLPLAGFVHEDRIALGALRTLGGRPLFE